MINDILHVTRAFQDEAKFQEASFSIHQNRVLFKGNMDQNDEEFLEVKIPLRESLLVAS